MTSQKFGLFDSPSPCHGLMSYVSLYLCHKINNLPLPYLRDISDEYPPITPVVTVRHRGKVPSKFVRVTSRLSFVLVANPPVAGAG